YCPSLTTESWIFPPVGNPTSGCGVFSIDPPVQSSPGPHPAKEPILIPPPYTDSVNVVTAPLDHRVLDLTPCRQSTSGCGVFSTDPSVQRLPGPHPTKEPILIPPSYTDSVKLADKSSAHSSHPTPTLHLSSVSERAGGASKKEHDPPTGPTDTAPLHRIYTVVLAPTVEHTVRKLVNCPWIFEIS
ncbi:hypothetical protein CRENBAI_011696, partial [Crenichthys baileyi]